MLPYSPLPFKLDLSSTFPLSASMMVNLFTVLDPEFPSFIDFSGCLERTLLGTLAGSLLRWSTTIYSSGQGYDCRYLFKYLGL